MRQDNSRILQDILRYSLKIEKNKQFNLKELSDWLAANCNSFNFERNTPKRYKRDKVSKEIGLLLGPLFKLGLISQTRLERRNGINEFVVLRYTTAGRLLALIIDSFDLERRLEDNHKIYETLKSHHTSNKSSKHQFFLSMLTVYDQPAK